MERTYHPVAHSNSFVKRPERILYICFYEPFGISTVPETVAFMQRESRFSVTVLNLCEHGKNGNSLSLSSCLNLNSFDAVIIHNSLSYNVDNLRTLDQLLVTPLRKFQGIKVLMKQDENYKFRELAEYVGETGYDLIFTCLPSDALPIIYPEVIVGKPRFHRMLTGYVTPTLRNIKTNIYDRPIDIGYRGSIQPLSFGRLAYEKRKIGDDVLRLLDKKNLNLDISSRWEDRFGGVAWFEFLTSCNATLGAESGASIFDLNGDLEQRCKKAEEKYGPIRQDDEYAELYLSELKDLEDVINYRQISPRHFEAAATQTLQLMHPGEYSKIFIAGKHYVELKKDNSNIEDVLDVVNSEIDRRRIVECAYDEIILNKKYWIETFVNEFDALLEEQLIHKSMAVNPVLEVGKNKSNVLLICAHEPSKDPRLSWTEQGALPEIQITQIGIFAFDDKSEQIYRTNNDGLVIVEPIIKFAESMFAKWSALITHEGAGWAGLSELSQMHFALGLDEPDFLELFDAPPNSDRTENFKSMLRFILKVTATLVTTIENIKGYEAIIATDLITLPAALILKDIANVPVIYDAHEYWPEADVAAYEFEQLFWRQMERHLVQHVEYRQTVTPGLAALMSSQYGCEFSVVPNCEPLSSQISKRPDCREKGDKCHFIYQGGFARKRGLKLLINAWPCTDKRAILLLRGPNNEYKDKLINKARELGLLGTRIFFPDPVSEDNLIEAAQDGDVGVIPYIPFGANHVHCCPNKTSQFMAASLPILANNTSFVKSVVDQAEVGIVTDFNVAENIVSAVLWFTENPTAGYEMGSKANEYFNNYFNWETVSQAMYDKLSDHLQETSNRSLNVFKIKNDISESIYNYPTENMLLCQWLCDKLPKKIKKKTKKIVKKIKRRFAN